MKVLFDITLGAAAAAAFILAVRWRGRRFERWVYAVGLAVAAAIYLGFAVAAAAAGSVALEAAGLVLFGAVAVAGARGSPLWLAFGWAAHVVWDLGLHGGPGRGYAPAWYPEVCVGFDLLLAAYLAWIFRGTEPP